MTTVGMHAAKSRLSELVAKVEAGEEVIITRSGKPAAKLVPIATQPNLRAPGLLKGKLTLDETFFDPLPEEELEAWEGR